MRQNINTDSTGEKFQQLFTWLLPAVYFLGGGLLVAFLLNFYHHQISHDPGDWGVLGDYFGGLMNPVISFATLLVAYAVWKLQRVELDETKRALKDQAETAERQRQEQRFFDLLRVYNQTLDSYTWYAGNGREHRGKEAVSDALSNLPEFLRLTLRHGFGQVAGGNELTPEFIASYWQKHSHIKNFNVYMRVVFRLLEEAEPLLGEQHQRYIGIFQTQLSDDEARLIGLLSWIDSSWANYLPLLQKYCLLKNFPEGPFRSDLMKLIGSRSFSDEGDPPC